MTREERIEGLKLLAALSKKPSDRMRCFTEVLAERSRQLAEIERPPVPEALRG